MTWCFLVFWVVKVFVVLWTCRSLFALSSLHHADVHLILIFGAVKSGVGVDILKMVYLVVFLAAIPALSLPSTPIWEGIQKNIIPGKYILNN